jgi:hypothetical protein
MRSTLTQLLSHWDSILDGLETGYGVDSVFLDFSKAFDMVETGVLLHKLCDSRDWEGLDAGWQHFLTLPIDSRQL